MDLEQGRQPAWAAFDHEWYRAQYHQSILEIAGDVVDDDLEAFWRDRGGAYGHSPNRYFDELFYRRSNPSVGEGIHRGIFISGYQHYEEIGYQGCAPHWLFNESDYFAQNPDLTIQSLRDLGLHNGYDHYIRYGQKEQRVSNIFFDPDVLRISLFQAGLASASPEGDFTRVLNNPDLGALRSSWYFDPDWYLQRYPDVREMISPGLYYSALHHYLSNDTPEAFDPNPFFDDAWYRETYPDVAVEVGRGAFRNGYAHFMRFGLSEGRQPFEGAILTPQDVNSQRDNAYITLVRMGGATPATSQQEMSRDAMRALQVRRVAVMFGQLTRAPLNFSYAGTPALSVVIPVENDHPALIDTLVSLHGARRFKLQIILVDLTGHRLTTRVDTWARGVTILREDGAFPLHVRARLLETVAAEHVLFLDPGMTLPDPNAVQVARHLGRDAAIAAIVPLSLDERGLVKDAGADLWKHGDLALIGAGVTADDAALQCRRTCDSFVRNAFMCRASDLPKLTLQDTWRSSIGYHAALGLTLRQQSPGQAIVFLPGFVVQDCFSDQSEQARLAGEDRLLILKRFGDICQLRPFSSGEAPRFGVSDVQSGRRVLLITRDLPRGTALGDQLRLLSVARDLVALNLLVTILSLEKLPEPSVALYDLFDETVSFHHVDLSRGLRGFLHEQARCFDFIWVNGVACLPNLSAAFEAARDALPLTGYILDARDHGLHDISRRVPSPDGSDGWSHDTASSAQLQTAFSEAWMFQRVVAANDLDVRNLRRSGLDRVVSLEGRRAGKISAGFDQRADILFGLPVLHRDDIGYQVLLWTLRHLMPRVAERLGYEVRLIVGAHAQTVELLSGLRYYTAMSAPLEGCAPLETLCDRARLMIDPSDSSAGLSLEAEIALSRGLPVIGAGEGSEPGVIYTSQAPELFADAVATLYGDAEAWEVYADFAQRSGADHHTVIAQTRDILTTAKTTMEGR